MLPFTEYIVQCRHLIQARHPGLEKADDKANRIIDANSPFELIPNEPRLGSDRIKYGALLIHGLLDSPFSLRDMGLYLQKQGILTRAILLPGHGTKPEDLLSITYQDWIKTVHYGIESLKQEVENIYLIGYSTGATLSIYHALQDSAIKGMVLLSPAIRIKAPVSGIVAWHRLVKWITRNHIRWLYQEAEVDYVKYQSIAFNAITQVAHLTSLIKSLRKRKALDTPIFMIMSREDETISSYHAIQFFSTLNHPDNRLLLYSSINKQYADKRIMVHLTHFPKLGIRHYSHISIPFSPDNLHYGIKGDYQYASHPSDRVMQYGAYNRIEQRIYYVLYALGLIKHTYRELTYNPDFTNMANEIVKFITI